MAKKLLSFVLCICMILSVCSGLCFAKYTETIRLPEFTLTIDGNNVPQKLEVTTPPNDITYNHGEDFDKTGMVVTVTYTDGTSKVVTVYTITDGDDLYAGQDSVTITYEENGITVTTEQPIKVNRVLARIEVTTPPSKTTYNHGDDFNTAGMVVTATYTDGSKAAVTGYTVTNGEYLSSNGQMSVTISYTENGVTKTTTQAITVKKVLESIAVTKAPNKTSYNHGDEFNTAGMVVTATYTDGTIAVVTGYTVLNGTDLATSQSYVTISYTENGVTKTATQPIAVNKVLESIAVTTAPNKTTYASGETFDPAGMVVTAYYNDNTSGEVTGYTITNNSNLTVGQSSVDISYTDHGVTKNTSQAVIVGFQVTYNANGGLFDGNNTTNIVLYQNTNNVLSGKYAEPNRTDYVFGGWYTDTACSTGNELNLSTVSSNITVYAKWTSNSNAAYTVQHWQQNIGGGSDQNSTNFTLKDTDNLTGTTGASVTPARKSYTGFTAPSGKSVTIAADGTTVVNYYYTRNSYTVTLNKGTGIATVTGAGTYQYGESVTINATMISTFFVWDAWSGDLVFADQNSTFIMPAFNLTLTAEAKSKTIGGGSIDVDKPLLNITSPMGTAKQPYDVGQVNQIVVTGTATSTAGISTVTITFDGKTYTLDGQGVTSFSINYAIELPDHTFTSWPITISATDVNGNVSSIITRYISKTKETAGLH